MSKLIESVHTLVIDGDMPAKAIASAIGKTETTVKTAMHHPLEPGTFRGPL